MMDSHIPVWLTRALTLAVVGVLLLGLGQLFSQVRSEMSGEAREPWAALPRLVCTPQGVMRMEVGDGDEALPR